MNEIKAIQERSGAFLKLQAKSRRKLSQTILISSRHFWGGQFAMTYPEIKLIIENCKRHNDFLYEAFINDINLEVLLDRKFFPTSYRKDEGFKESSLYSFILKSFYNDTNIRELTNYKVPNLLDNKSHIIHLRFKKLNKFKY